ncbi:hypothetical protein EBZ80_17965 [bacterium]|nr:hypothetical protein [bacterium]
MARSLYETAGREIREHMSRLVQQCPPNQYPDAWIYLFTAMQESGDEDERYAEYAKHWFIRTSSLLAPEDYFHPNTHSLPTLVDVPRPEQHFSLLLFLHAVQDVPIAQLCNEHEMFADHVIRYLFPTFVERVNALDMPLPPHRRPESRAREVVAHFARQIWDRMSSISESGVTFPDLVNRMMAMISPNVVREEQDALVLRLVLLTAQQQRRRAAVQQQQQQQQPARRISAQQQQAVRQRQTQCARRIGNALREDLLPDMTRQPPGQRCGVDLRVKMSFLVQQCPPDEYPQEWAYSVLKGMQDGAQSPRAYRDYVRQWCRKSALRPAAQYFVQPVIMLPQLQSVPDRSERFSLLLSLHALHQVPVLSLCGQTMAENVGEYLFPTFAEHINAQRIRTFQGDDINQTVRSFVTGFATNILTHVGLEPTAQRQQQAQHRQRMTTQVVDDLLTLIDRNELREDPDSPFGPYIYIVLKNDPSRWQTQQAQGGQQDMQQQT